MKATTQEISKIMERPTCTVEEAAKVLRCGRSQAYKAVNCGQIPSIRIGKKILVSTVALRQLLQGEPVSAA